MVRYFYALTPLVLVGTVVLLALPWLGLFALMVFALVALGMLGALASAVVATPYLLIRSIGRRWHGRSVAHQPSASFSLVTASALGSRWSSEEEERDESLRQPQTRIVRST